MTQKQLSRFICMDNFLFDKENLFVELLLILWRYSLFILLISDVHSFNKLHENLQLKEFG